MHSPSDPHSSGKTPKRRQHRQRRVNALQAWQEGTLDHTPVRERWSREFRAPRIKRMKAPVDHFPPEFCTQGLAVEVHRRTCELRLASGDLVKARYRSSVVDELGFFPAVGDQVQIGRMGPQEEYTVFGVLPRQSALIRPGPRDRYHQYLTLAANVDQVVMVASVVDPEFNYGFADRFLLAAGLSELPLILVLNKMDLVTQLPEAVRDFLSLAQHVVEVSCYRGDGLSLLQSLLQNKTSVFSGQSGVGKSSLINRLVPEASLRIGEVRHKDGKGRHTTTTTSLVDLPQGGIVIDTPGIRSLGLIDLDENELARCFPGFFESDRFTCRFNNCLHLSEPGCSVLERLEQGSLSPARYQSYLRILRGGK